VGEDLDFQIKGFCNAALVLLNDGLEEGEVDCFHTLISDLLIFHVLFVCKMFLSLRRKVCSMIATMINIPVMSSQNSELFFRCIPRI